MIAAATGDLSPVAMLGLGFAWLTLAAIATYLSFREPTDEEPEQL